jgi:hypothetical protein
MSCKVPYLIDDIDVDNISYGDIKTNKNKTIIYLKYNDNNKMKNIVFQTPTLLNVNDAVEKNNIHELDIPLFGKIDTKVHKFKSFIDKIDSKIMRDARVNHKWFEHFHHLNTIKYQRTIRESNNSSYKDGMIRLKLLKTNDFETTLLLNNNNISYDSIPKNSWVKSILEIYALWINENGFGLFIRPILIDFKINNKISYNYKILEEPSEESDEVDDNLYTVQQDKDKDGDNYINFSNLFIKTETDVNTTTMEVNDNNLSSATNVGMNQLCSSTSE